MEEVEKLTEVRLVALVHLEVEVVTTLILAEPVLSVLETRAVKVSMPLDTEPVVVEVLYLREMTLRLPRQETEDLVFTSLLSHHSVLLDSLVVEEVQP